ncbi:hypothetical protein HELRODRAFT_76379 [Helobdella robusta]|uniref:Uncharacterized protein n=1 Tax=Helobdella robusta TaxID=6412 RepID=T1G2J3_HELRO|nr:hypothetical protein HELRODRAFT_76379 [Helobdella robusta]ESO07388.1 hypothetical protein HELRODRAFT_76379 [Helobdella robusta]
MLLIRTWDWLIGKLNVSVDRKFIFVTGCDSGFGEELCVELDRLGCHVFAGCLTVEGMVNIKDKCSAKVFPVKLDVRDHASILNYNFPLIPGLWALVNNAGICGAVGPTQWLNAGDFKEVLETNLLGAIDVTLSALPLLKSENKYDSCRIVNMISVLAHFHSPLTLPYTLSKASLSIFSKVLRMELKGMNVRVCTIEPGAHISNFTDRTEMSLKQTWDRLPLVDQLLFGKQNYEKS